ncbi:MAG: crotonobetainyl-CoA:carnitine CoA-transferase CaiB-like acyl-CoA transferase [Saprospiraceae bacterium]
MDNLLSDLVVVELASVLAGPLAGSFLAELGARVIKVENSNIGGDVTRQWKHPSEDAEASVSAYYASANTGKEILFLDLQSSEDYQKLIGLVASADIVISNFQKRTAKKLKVDYESVKLINQKIIFAQLVAYSYDDPRPGYDLIMQAETGFISMNGSDHGGIAKMPVALIDVIAGHQIKEAILLGVITKLKTGKGSYSEVSLYKSGISALANQASNYLMNNNVPFPMGTLHPNIAPYGDIVTTSDNFIVILGVGSDKQFEKLGKTLNLAKQLLHTFSLNKERVDRRQELITSLQATCKDMSYEDLSIKLRNAKIPFCRVSDLDKVFRTPLAIEMIIEETIEGRHTSKVKNVAFDLIIN